MNTPQKNFCKQVLSDESSDIMRITQLGGGVVLIKKNLWKKKQLKFEKENVIISICEAICKSDTCVDMKAKKALCCMFLQHASAHAPITDTVHAALQLLF
jgi:hypothetical protein